MSHPVSRVSFPEKQFKNYLNVEAKEFNFSAMILATLNRYCYQLMFYETFSIPFNFKQTYHYIFSKFEISSLATKSPQEIITNKKIKTNYDFTLSTFKKHYKGEILINTTLINKGTFETSFYKITIELIPEDKFLLTPFFLKKSALNFYIGEFLQKIWIPIWKEIDKIPNSTRTKSINRIINTINTIDITEQLNYITISEYEKELISDTFNIVYSICLEKKEQYSQISAANILKIKGLKENPNAKGIRGGYKAHERNKIFICLFLLNALGMLIVREISPFYYFISIPYRMRNKSTTEFPLKLVQYNLKTQLWNKRLGTQLVKERGKKTKVIKLLTSIIPLCESFKPAQIRDKFEKIMDELCRDKIISDWYYKKIDEDSLQGKNWLEKWKKLEIIYRY